MLTLWRGLNLFCLLGIPVPLLRIGYSSTLFYLIHLTAFGIGVANKNFFIMKRLFFAILGVLIFCGLSAQEIPQKISYQGKLLENGIPVTGTKSITFAIGTTWSETKNVSINEGLYSVTLGETTPIPISTFDNSTSVSLQISVAGTTLSPQTDILSVAYAYKAEKAVDTEKIAGNPVSGNPSTNQILKWSGSQWESSDDNDNQTLSISGNDLLISDGNTITLPTGSSYTAGDGISISSNEISMSGTYTDEFTAQTVMKVGAPSTTFTGGFSGDIVADRHLAADEDIYAGGNIWGDDILADDDIIVDDDMYVGDDLQVTGNISKGGGSFKIDHPLDPKNKYLYHSFVESPDMMNVYNGNIVLDNNGEAIVELPEWFDVLNKDFRYQLTCIGGFAPVYISEKISGNSFKIAGGTIGMEVSWQITGIRQDPYANQNRIQVEVEKPEKEKGHYLHYKEYNQPVEKSIRVAKHPEVLDELNK
jgi:hypothetical protein